MAPNSNSDVQTKFDIFNTLLPESLTVKRKKKTKKRKKEEKKKKKIRSRRCRDSLVWKFCLFNHKYFSRHDCLSFYFGLMDK